MVWTRSRTSADSVINAALEKRVSFYVIHLPLFEPRDGRLEVRRPRKAFRISQRLAANISRRRRKISAHAEENDLTPIFQAIEEDLKSQYLLGFYIRISARQSQTRFLSDYEAGGCRILRGRPFGYSRTHKFMFNRPPDAQSLPN